MFMAGAREVASYGAKWVSDEAAYRRVIVHPVLVWAAPPATKEEPLLFATRPGDRIKRPAPGQAVFYVVAKSVKNAFADEVTLGRTANNDITIEDNSVSRFHAYLSPDKKGPVAGRTGQQGAWSLVDAKSTMGTFLSGKQLKPKTPVPIASGTTFKVGEVELQFLDVEGFWKFLRGLLKGPVADGTGKQGR
jgi:pSer/pThr/pTyr-binding forkhead associated (FHA) protein